MAKSTEIPKYTAIKTTVASSIRGINSTQAVDNHRLADDPHLVIREEQELLTAKEAGKILRIHPVTVRLKAAAGVILGRQIGNRWRFSRTRINEWLMAA